MMPDGTQVVTSAPIAYTIFPDHRAFDKEEHSATLEEIANAIVSTAAEEKAALPFLKLATFSGERTRNNSLRANAHVHTISGVEADLTVGRFRSRRRWSCWSRLALRRWSIRRHPTHRRCHAGV
jgi:hypothetical protein